MVHRDSVIDHVNNIVNLNVIYQHTLMLYNYYITMLYNMIAGLGMDVKLQC